MQTDVNFTNSELMDDSPDKIDLERLKTEHKKEVEVLEKQIKELKQKLKTQEIEISKHIKENKLSFDKN